MGKLDNYLSDMVSNLFGLILLIERIISVNIILFLLVSFKRDARRHGGF